MKKILLVDDEPQLLEMIKMRLEANNYEVMTLSSANGLISNMHSFDPDIILLDMVMPGIGGLDACEMLNNDPIGSKIPIIVLSALSKSTDKLKAYKLGIVDYMEKPINTDDLIRRIEKALEYK